MILFIDDYSSCKKTFVTLCVYHEYKNIELVSELLGIDPTRVCNKGDKRHIKKNGWFYTTKDLIESRDVRRHLYFLTDKLDGKYIEISKLKSMGFEIFIMCFWESSTGNGGPMLNSSLMGKLYLLGLDLDFDIWIGNE